MAFVAYLTDAGLVFQQQCLAQGSPMIISAAFGGVGTVTNPKQQTAMLDVKAEFLLKPAYQQSNMVTFLTTLDTSSVAEPFVMQQFGLIAKDNGGAEVLYALSQDEVGRQIAPGDIVDMAIALAVHNELELLVLVNPLAMLTAGDYGLPNGVAQLDEYGQIRVENLTLWDCGWFPGEMEVVYHSYNPYGHSGLVIDGGLNLVAGGTPPEKPASAPLPVGYTLEEHVEDEDTHENLIIDGGKEPKEPEVA